MGLSVKWATCNVGASTPGDYGGYYAWGETSTKWIYDEDNCQTFQREAYSDVAQANWGDSWRLPTKNEMQELLDNCTWKWTTQNGHNGYRVTGPNGHSIFLPATGFYTGVKHVNGGEFGNYWISTPIPKKHNERAWHLLFGRGTKDNRYIKWDYRSRGRTIRPVAK